MSLCQHMELSIHWVSLFTEVLSPACCQAHWLVQFVLANVYSLIFPTSCMIWHHCVCSHVCFCWFLSLSLDCFSLFFLLVKKKKKKSLVIKLDV